MTNTSSTHTVNVTDNGSTSKVIKSAKQLAGTYDEITASVIKAHREMRAMEAAERGAVANARRQASRDSGSSRGLGGQTGAEGRDFAKQAQGLGGLVHVYATFAANIFAVSAAFNALSKAADTTNMVKGLNQLGAQTGNALGSLSKQLALATDGAISLRDAMSAVAMSSSAGMTNSAILRMGAVAKQASQALGVNMTDAMSRLSRGITKLEPELLDELGIFTKIEKATQDYARSVGKTASALTDFERRQAFANAVLEEGEKKFSALNLDANPYSKLSASLANVAQTGLELINKVLEPIVKYFAASPTGLSVAIAALAGVLLKQAIPAFGMFRENAKRMEEETRLRVKNQVREQQDAAAMMDTIAAQRAEKEFRSSKETMDKIASLQKREFSKAGVGLEIKGLLRKSPFDLTPDEIKKIEDKHKELDEKISKGAFTRSEQIALDNLNKRKKAVDDLFKKMVEAGDAVSNSSEANDQKWFTTYKQKETYLKRLETLEKRAITIANAGDTANTFGPVVAFKELMREVDESGDSKLGKLGTKVKGTFAIATTAIGNAINAFGVWGQAIALAGVAFSVLDGYMSTGAKEAEKFSQAITASNDASEALSNTLSAINDKTPDQLFSIESLQAQATAINNVTDSLKNLLSSFEKMLSTRSTWESMFDWMWDKIGMGAGDKLATNIAASISDTLKVLGNGPEAEQFRKSVSDSLGKSIDFTNIKTIKESFKDLPEREILNFGNTVQTLENKAVSYTKNSAAALSSYKENIKNLSKEVQTYNNTLVPTDSFSKFGMGLMKLSKDLSLTTLNAKDSLLALKETLGSMETLSIISPQAAKELIDNKQEIEDTITQLGLLNAEYNKRVSTTSYLEKEKAVKDASLQVDLASNNVRTKSDEKTLETAQNRLKTAQEIFNQEKRAADQIKIAQDAQERKAEKLKKTFATLSETLQIEGLRFLEKGLSTAVANAAISFNKALSGLISKYGGFTGDLEIKYDNQALEMQKRDIEAKYQNTLELKRLSLAIALDSAKREQMNLAGSLSDADKNKTRADFRGGIDPKSNIGKYIVAGEQVKEIEAQQKALSKGASGLRELRESAKTDLGTSRNALLGLMDVYTQLIGKETQLASIVGKQRENDVKLKIEENIAKPAFDRAKQRDTANQRLAEEKAVYDYLSQTLEGYSEVIEVKKNSLDITKLQRDAEEQQLQIVDKIKAQAIIIANSTGDNQKRAIETVTELWKDFDSSRSKAATDRNVLETRQADEKSKKQLDAYDKLKKQEEDYKNFVIENRLEIMSVELELAGITKSLSDEDLVNARTELAISKELQAYNKQAEELQRKKSESSRTLVADLNAINSISGIPEEAKADLRNKAIDADNKRIERLTAEGRLNDELYGKKLAILSISKEQEIAQIKYNKLLEFSNSLTENLGLLFGELGTSIGESVTALIDFSKNQKAAQDQYAARAAAIANDKNLDPQQKAKAEKALKEELTQAELKNVQKVASASKKMFGEKTAAYKAISAVEKATAIQSSILAAKAQMESLIALPTTLATGISKLFEQGGWAGFAGAAALISMVSSISGGMKGSAPISIPDTLGTGQSFNPETGTTENNGGGIIGSPTEKSKTIETALNNLNSINKDIYEFNTSSTYQALLDIRDNTSGLARFLATRGILTNRESPFAGIKTGEVLNVDFAKILGNLPLGGIFGKGIGNILNNFSKDLFGGYSLEKIGEGLAISGNTKDLLAGNYGNGIAQFAKFNQSGNLNYEYQVINPNEDPQLQKFITGTVKSFNNAILTTMEGLGSNRDEINRVLENTRFALEVDTTLSVEKQAQQIEQQIGILMDQAIMKIDPAITELWEKYGEVNTSIADFALKLSNDIAIIDKSFNLISKTDFSNLTKPGQIDASQNLVKAFGSSKEFSSAIVSFNNTYLTEAEKMTKKESEITKGLTKLGLSTDSSKESLKQLVLGWTDFSEVGAESYKTLLNITEAADQLNAYKEKLANAQFDQNIKVLQLQGRAEEALAAQREKDIQALDASLRAGQRYINSLEDEKKAKEQLVEITKLIQSVTVDLGSSISKLMGISSDAFNEQKAAYLKQASFDNLNFFVKNKVNPKASLITEDDVNILLQNAGGNLGKAIQSVFDLVTAQPISYEDKKELMSLVQGVFSSVANSVDEVAKKIASLNVSKLNKVVEIYQLLGKSEEALAIQRNLELSTIDASLKPFYEYLYALQDEQSIKDKLKEAYQKEEDRLKGLIEGFDGMIKALKDARKALLLGESSTLTPKQKMLTARTEYDALKQTISSLQGKTDDASIKARNEAINKLPEVSNEYLDAARTFYASSTEYSSIFDQVTGYMSSTETRLSAERDIASEQLTELQTSTGYMEIMKNNSNTVTELTQKLEAAQDRTRAAAEAAIPLINDLIAATNKGSTPGGTSTGTSTGTGTGTSIGTSTGAVTSGSSLSADTITKLRNDWINVTKTDSSSQDAAIKSYMESLQTAGISLSQLERAVPELKVADMQSLAARAGVAPSTGYTTQTAVDVWKQIDEATKASIREATLAVPYQLANTSSGAQVFLNLLKNKIIEEGKNLYYVSRVSGFLPSSYIYGPDGKPADVSTKLKLDSLHNSYGINTYAKGGLAQGLSMVGEYGPELVDFTNPGRVYTAAQTEGMFRGSNMADVNRQIVQEIKQLREEIKQLREQQRIETGHVINATYDAQAQNAEAIVSTVQSSTSKQVWANKTANTLTLK